MTPTAEAVERLLPGRRVTAVVALVSSERATVERLQLAPLRGAVERIVTKRFTVPAGYAREAAALSCLPPGLPAPTLLAEDRAEGLVVMSDVGVGPSVADALLGADRAAAEAALGAWVEALATVHKATVDSGVRFASALAERGEATPVTVDPIPGWLDGVPGALRASASEVGPGFSEGAEGELAALATSLGTGAEALSPGDTCPDNNVRVGAGLTLIDFEEAAFRHVAWDLAYLRVPWPSCWCAWAIPEPVASEALGHYVAASKGPTVGVERTTFEREVDATTVGWGLISGSWFLPSALARDDTMGPPGWTAPPRRATVVERFRVAAAAAERLGYGLLAGSARAWQDALEQRWGPQALAAAPALR